jgi:predicted GNAT family acetyltransferase
MHLTHTIVPDELAGKGLAGILLKDVLDQIKAAGKKAVAECSYVVKYQEKHPELSDIFGVSSL